MTKQIKQIKQIKQTKQTKQDRKYVQTSKDELLKAAIDLAAVHGYQCVTREQLSERTGCSPANISRIFGTMPEMRRAIIGAAINQKHLGVIAQGLATKHPRALKAPQELRKAAAQSIMGG